MQLGRDWNFYSYQYGDSRENTATVRFDVERAVMPCPDTHLVCRRLLLRDAAEPDLAAFEADLPNLLADIDCMLVGVLRYPQTEELVFQIEDIDGFTARHEQLIAKAPADIEFFDTAGWDFFVDRVTPNLADWQRIDDRESIARLVAQGIDPELQHDLHHAFLGSAEELDKILHGLQSNGFHPVDSEDGRLILKRKVRLTLPEVSRVSIALKRFSRSQGVVYDGWKLS